MITASYDFVIIGSGFAGSIMSMVLRRLGKSVLLLERGSHPRFAIGESSTPFANLLLERLATDYDLPFLRSLSEWGQWQENHPKLPVGLKRGFTFYYHTADQPLDFSDRTRQLLVAASPNDRVADTHWYRPTFDDFLVQKARELGVHYIDHATISDVENVDRWSLTVTHCPKHDERNSQVSISILRITASFLIDASGPNGFPHLQNTAVPCSHMPPTSAVYAHFRDLLRLDQLTASKKHSPERRNHSLPYPPDDAAVHHVFPGGWIWVLRFNNGITSAGAAYRTDLQPAVSPNPEALWLSILRKLPALEETFRSATPITPFYFTQNLSFRRSRAAGSNWVALPSAAGFIDPLLSTGFALTLLGILRLADHFRNGFPDPARYETQTFLELDAASDLVSALYSKMASPEEFSLLTLLYFAAMSFTETAWRVDKTELASGFLLVNDPVFSAARARICAFARAGEVIVRETIAEVIAPYDVAGLTDWKRMPWYPVNFDDLRKNAHKLQIDLSHLAPMFAKAGLVDAA